MEALPLSSSSRLAALLLSGAALPLLSVSACGGDDPTSVFSGSGGNTFSSGGTTSGGAPAGGTASTSGGGPGVGTGGGELGGMGGVPGDGDGDGDGDGGSEGDGTGGFGPGPEAEGFCESDKDCKAMSQLCDLERMVCVECLSDSDCGDDAVCEHFRCASFDSCESSLQCGDDEVCDDERDVCVECVRDQDCADDEVCRGSTCAATCESDKDCRDLNQVCLLSQEACVDCEKDADCGPSSFCSDDNQCNDTLCDPGSTFCEGDSLLTCGGRGLSFSSRECRHACGADDEGAFCTNGKNGKCIASGGDVCRSIVEWTHGEQIIDGSDEEFCDVPTTVLTFGDAGYTQIVDESVDTDRSRATIRMAYDADGLHLHVHVSDDEVMHSGGQIFDGDNLQFFFSGEAPTESNIGNTINGGSQQLMILPAIGETPARDEISPGDGPRDYEYATRLVDDGYEVEALIPWVDVVPEAGDEIGVNLLIGVQDSPGGRDFEYALSLNELDDSQCGADNFAPWCDARHWCSPTLE